MWRSWQGAATRSCAGPPAGAECCTPTSLTYSIVAPVGLLAAYDGPSVTGTYLAISRGLAEGLRLAGVPCEIASGRRHARTTAEARLASAACFDAPSSYELTAGGRKIVGSAQTRRGGVLLQHGSIPMTMDHATAAAVMGLPEGSGAEMLARSVATVKEFAPECTVEDLAAALMEGLRRHLMPQARPGALTPEEVERAESFEVEIPFRRVELHEVMKRSTQSRSSSLSGPNIARCFEAGSIFRRR